MYAYRVDDWLVIRTDMAGHQSVVSTEFWCEWDGPRIGGRFTRRDELNVIDRARRLDKQLNWMGCEDGYCGKCELTLQQ